MLLFAGGVVILVAVVAVARGVDVRLALLGSAFALAGLEGDVTPVVREFLATLSKEKFVVPICSAMAFAYVLKETRCDQHLVRLLTRPLQKARSLLIPGVVGVGFLVNIPIISQTSTAVCIGTVVVPLMQAAKLGPVVIGASLLLGSSIGGELFNPGAPELNTVSEALSARPDPLTGETHSVRPQEVVRHLYPLVLPHLLMTTLLFWWLMRPEARREHDYPAAEGVTQEPIRLSMALVPLVPLLLLFLTGPPLDLLSVPERWVVEPKEKGAYGTRLIGLAMLVGTLVAMLVVPGKANRIPGAFFEGAGVAFTQVISLIVTANCFGKAVEQVGLARLVGEWVATSTHLLHPISAALPLGFGALSGSGMAATQSLYPLYVEPSLALGVNPADTGAMVSLGAAAGRTMSPVAAVALMAARLTQTDAFTLVARVAPPLLASMAALVGARMLGWV